MERRLKILHMCAKVARSQQDLERSLSEQLHLLEASSVAYDQGDESQAKNIAVRLRVLLYDPDPSNSKSRSLLRQLGRMNMLFYDTAISIDLSSLNPQCSLCEGLFSLETGKGCYKPFYDRGQNEFSRQVEFNKWWNSSIALLSESLTRRDLTLKMTNQDGGAHVDPGLDENYARLAQDNALGWSAVANGISQPMRGAELASVRQIGHEVLKSFGIKTPEIDNKGVHIAGVSFAPVTATTLPKVGRNDPCPCGSGKKYKNCHWKSRA